VEKSVKFKQAQFLTGQTFCTMDPEGNPLPRFQDIPVAKLHPLVLAYVGDAYFNLYVRSQLLFFEQSKVRILHHHGAKMVSATLQAAALRQLEEQLTEAEAEFVRRGRNTKSSVPKSASIADYRYSTGFEGLLGYLYLSGQAERLQQLTQQAFQIISRKLANLDEGKVTDDEGETNRPHP
jgi:ribonuclease-3 family protein